MPARLNFNGLQSIPANECWRERSSNHIRLNANWDGFRCLAQCAKIDRTGPAIGAKYLYSLFRMRQVGAILTSDL